MEKSWDGKDVSGRYQYSPREVAAWDMTIDEVGNIYYVTHHEKPEHNIWCPASRLTGHLHNLIKYNLVQMRSHNVWEV